MRFRKRAILGGILGGCLAYLGAILIPHEDEGMEVASLAARVGVLAWFGAFVGAFGFQRGSQAWNDILDTIEDTLSP